jgi:hypothetical protein
MSDLPPNVMVLTTGLSGSSLATGFIAQAGFWMGENTEYKNNSTGQYETFENSRFVELNDQLIRLSGVQFNPLSWYDDQLREKFAALYDTVDLAEFEQFASICQQHQPWVLKDPKAWITLRFWLRVFEGQHIKCVIVSRNAPRLWLSQTLKRTIYDFRYLKSAEARSIAVLSEELAATTVPFLRVEYDALVQDTSTQINKINLFLSTKLTMSDWGAVFDPKNVKRPSFTAWIKAVLIYFKNYGERIYPRQDQDGCE